MKNCQDILITWLNNAYTMESSIIKTLEMQAKDAEEMPDVQASILEHIESTRVQADQVAEQIENLGGNVSKMKEYGGEAMAYLQAMLGKIPEDKLVKNAIMQHSTEHFEMATYQAIEELANICGEEEVAAMAKNILEQEKAMGEKTAKIMPRVVRQFYSDQLDKE